MGNLSIFNPMSAVSDKLFGQDSSVGQLQSFANDPLDLNGYRARNVSDSTSGIAMQGAQDAINAQEEMRKIVEGLMAPYRQQGDAALGDFTAMSTTGQANTPLSPEYQWQREQGIQNINRGMGASGRKLSTARDQKLGGFLNALGQEEANLQYGRNLDAIKTGQGALDTVGGANSASGQNVNSLYGNLGNVLNANLQNYGQQRNQSFQQAGNALQGLGNYMAYNSNPSYQSPYTSSSNPYGLTPGQGL